MRTTQRIALLVAAVVAVALGPAPTASAGIEYQWGDYHWNRPVPFALELGDNVNGVWDGYLNQASGQWSAADPLDTTVVSGRTTARTCKPSSGRVEVCNNKYGSNGWLGIASIWLSGVHITQGTVKLNDTYFNLSKYNTPDWRAMVTCQEIGHTFGLGHADETFGNTNLGTCMDYTNAPGGGLVGDVDYGPANTAPGYHDLPVLQQMYAHLEPTSTGSTSTLPAAAVGNTQADWGRAIGVNGNGRADEFYMDLGNGTAVVTHVIWAD